MTPFESLPVEVQEVIKALACYRPRWSVHGMWLCDFCNASLDRYELLGSFKHKSDCAVLKAKVFWPEFGEERQ